MRACLSWTSPLLPSSLTHFRDTSKQCQIAEQKSDTAAVSVAMTVMAEQEEITYVDGEGWISNESDFYGM